MWNKMSKEEKQMYQDISDRDRERYERHVRMIRDGHQEQVVVEQENEEHLWRK